MHSFLCLGIEAIIQGNLILVIQGDLDDPNLDSFFASGSGGGLLFLFLSRCRGLARGINDCI
jgi:hypothetical protein